MVSAKIYKKIIGYRKPKNFKFKTKLSGLSFFLCIKMNILMQKIAKAVSESARQNLVVKKRISRSYFYCCKARRKFKSGKSDEKDI